MQREKGTAGHGSMVFYLGVSRSGCAILCLDGEEACRLRI